MVNRRRVFLPFFCLLLSFSAVALRLFFVQVWFHEELSASVERMACRTRPEEPRRGMILDRWGKILAMSVRNYSVFVDPREMNEPRRIQATLKRFNITVNGTALSSMKGTSYVPVGGGLDAQAVQDIRAQKLDGIGFEAHYSRQYPEGGLASHLLGVVGKDGSGLLGVELARDKYLSGKKVNNVKYRDGRGREISTKAVAADAKRGEDVYLTIDRTLQFIAEQEIEKAWSESRAKRATVIIQDPATGEILAMASFPGFDPGNPQGLEYHLKNPAISDVFEPGSTFKLVTTAAVIEEKAVKPGEVIWCEDGKYVVNRHTISDHEKKGLLTVPQIMEASSNIGTAKLGMRLGKERLYQYIKQFGFYNPTGIELPGEAKGLLKKPEAWSGLSLPVISFGQEVGVTALQITNAYSSIANGGLLLEPKIVREIRTSSGDTVYRTEKRVIRRAVSPETAMEMRRILTGVVELGTGQLARVPGYSVGGKTGTAQKRDPNTGRYSSSAYIASFCGIIPMSAPRMTIFVMLDEPQGDYWASSRAAPVFNRIASRAMRYLEIPPDRETMQVCTAKSVVSKQSRR